MNNRSVISKRTMVMILIILLVVAFPFSPMANGYLVGVLVRILIFIALGQSWNIVAGIGGQLSLGHGIFFGIGAYTTALLFNDFNISPWIGLFLGLAISVVVATIMGGVTFHLRGIYFALATVAISMGIEKVARHYADITGGDAGLAVRYLGDAPWAMQFKNEGIFVLIGVALVTGFYLYTRYILNSKFGYELQAVRDDEEAAAAAGVAVYRTKMKGLVISAVMTSLVGTLSVQAYLSIDPGTAFGMFQAIQIQLPPLIGGLGTALGPVLGGTVMILASEITNWASTKIGIDGIDVLVYGFILLGVILYAPSGILGRIRKRQKAIKNQKGASHAR